MAATKRPSTQERIDGERRADAASLARLGLNDPKESLLCLPAAYADCRTPQRSMPDKDDEDRRLYLLTLTGNFFGYARNKRQVANFGIDGWDSARVHACKGGRLAVELRDQRGNIVTWSQFGGAYQAQREFGESSSGDPLVIVARATRMGRSFVLDNAEPVPARAVGKIWTKYLGIAGRVSGDVVERLVIAQLDNPDALRWCATKLVGATGLRVADALAAVAKPDDGPGFASFEQLLRSLHVPASPEEGWAARATCNRLAALAVQSAALRHHSRAAHPQAPLPVDLGSLDAIARTQPETLTAEQRAAIRGIAEAFTDPKPLNGLLTGDVGTGKTLAYLIPLVAAQRAGARVAIIAPTELLANQISLQAIERFGPHGARVERVPTGARKIHDPGAILVSTYGLGSTAKRCDYAPQVLVCDEQHKMSTEAREALLRPWTHVLEASATPIPRSLAAALYGGMKTFTLLESPVRKNVHSLVYDIKDRPRGASMLKWVLRTGQKAAVIYPRVESRDHCAQTVLTAAAALELAFPGKVAVLHGGMSDAEKSAMMAMVRSGERPIIVGSTVMETGIDIPLMAGMIVRDADRFGASQLHQLRGRLARNGGEAWFMMMVEDLDLVPQDARARLQAVAETNNGYKLAEMDLVQRGFGDLDGTDQSGAAETVFKLVRLRPEDFLRNKLALDLEGESRAHEVCDGDARDRAQAAQPRLFA